MKDFAETFDLGINFFHMRGASLTNEEFIEDVRGLIKDWSMIEKSRYIMISMMGLKP